MEVPADGARHQLVESWLMERDDAAPDGIDSIDIDVYAGHIVAEGRQTGTGHEADVAGADDRYPTHTPTPDRFPAYHCRVLLTPSASPIAGS